jgi:serine acetyltransferase
MNKLLNSLLYHHNLFWKRQFFGIINSISQRDSRVYFCCVVTFKLPKGVRLIHPVGVVIGKSVKFGKNVRILQNATIGSAGLSKSLTPTIGNNVIIGPGAVVVGSISIGDNVIIGANTVITKDVPSNTIVKPPKPTFEPIKI